jgi:hypothetical protein
VLVEENFVLPPCDLMNEDVPCSGVFELEITD